MGKAKTVDPRWIAIDAMLQGIDHEAQLGLDFTAGQTTFAQIALENVRKLVRKARTEMLAVAQKPGRNVTANRPIFRPLRKEVCT
jgi:hypothetical protein